MHSGAWPSLSASLCFCEFLTPFQTSNFSEHFLPPLMSSILPSIIYSGVTFSCFPMKIPSFLGSLSPSQIQYLTLIYPAFLFLRTTPFTLSSRPALAVDSVSRDISSRGNSFVSSQKFLHIHPSLTKPAVWAASSERTARIAHRWREQPSPKLPECSLKLCLSKMTDYMLRTFWSFTSIHNHKC